MTHRDDSGNVQVDFVWGNMPMQPDDDRLDSVVYAAGEQNVGWSGTTKYYSDYLQVGNYDRTLNNLEYLIPADNHSTAEYGYSNYPGFIPNYAGDGDSGLEAVVPNLMRKTLAEANIILDKVNLNLFARAHNPEINYIESTDKTVRVWAYDYSAYGDSALVGIKAGDQIWVDNTLYNFGSDPLTVTKVNDDGEDSWIEFETPTALNLDDYADGTIWAGPNLVDVITVQRFWNQPGTIKNEGTNIHVRYVGD